MWVEAFSLALLFPGWFLPQCSQNSCNKITWAASTATCLKHRFQIQVGLVLNPDPDLGNSVPWGKRLNRSHSQCVPLSNGVGLYLVGCCQG